jgi:hypothetical protein
VLTALARKVPHPNAVRLALESQREARQAPPPVVVQLSEKARLRDTVIHAQPLASYDQLSRVEHADRGAVSEVVPPMPSAAINASTHCTQSKTTSKRSRSDESKK